MNVKRIRLTNVRNTDVRTSIIEVSKLKQAIEMSDVCHDYFHPLSH